jgi:hypothetical protein
VVALQRAALATYAAAGDGSLGGQLVGARLAI